MRIAIKKGGSRQRIVWLSWRVILNRAMHKAAVQAERKITQNIRSEAQKRKMRNYRPGCLEGRIGVYGAFSSPIGRLVRATQKYQ